MDAGIIGYKKEAPSDARQVRSRNALTGALLELLEERPFDQLTIREITARAGTGYATFFRHYPTKEALLGDVASEEIGTLLSKTVPVLHDEDSYQSTQALCAYVWKHRKLWFALLTGGAAGIVREEFIRQARQLVHDQPVEIDWLPADLGVVYGTASTIDLLSWWLAQEELYSPEQIAEILDRLVISGLVGKGASQARGGE